MLINLKIFFCYLFFKQHATPAIDLSWTRSRFRTHTEKPQSF